MSHPLAATIIPVLKVGYPPFTLRFAKMPGIVHIAGLCQAKSFKAAITSAAAIFYSSVFQQLVKEREKQFF